MQVRDVQQPWLVPAAADETLARGAERMRRYNVGWAVVFDGEKLAGILTERDVLRACVEGARPEVAVVSEYMSADPVTIDSDDSVGRAAETMLSLSARHLPVVEGGRVTGMISARDLLHAIASEDAGSVRSRRGLDRLVSRRPKVSVESLVENDATE